MPPGMLLIFVPGPIFHALLAREIYVSTWLVYLHGILYLSPLPTNNHLSLCRMRRSYIAFPCQEPVGIKVAVLDR